MAQAIRRPGMTTPVQIYASALMCDEQVRSTANREAAKHPGAIVRVACVPVVPGE